MKQGFFTLTENTRIARDVYRMRLAGDTSAVTAPGQFVNIRLDGRFLRRPISVCDKEGETLTLIYKVVGQGTAQMAEMRPGERLDLLTGLGNGYDLSRAGARPLLAGGGAGVPPLYLLARELSAAGREVTAILGFNTAEEIFLQPAHPYTWALLSSMPDLDTRERLEAIPGTPPNMIHPPRGDAFAPRNPYALNIDFEREPPVFRLSDTHYAATWLLHPKAEKVEMPESLARRIQRMKEAGGRV